MNIRRNLTNQFDVRKKYPSYFYGFFIIYIGKKLNEESSG